MSVSSDTSSGLHLPQPTAGGLVDTAQNEAVVAGVPQPASDDSGGVPVTQQFHAATPQTQIDTSRQQPSTQSDGADELDKEWINKAKLIVEQTKQDPFTMSKEVGRAKADYLRIRFNKHIKLGPDQTL